LENSEVFKKASEDCSDAKEGKVTSLKKEKKTVWPPQLFNLTGLQKEAHKAYGYAPEKTLSIAQSLYEKHKCLSYPRTPSVVMGDENTDLVKDIYKRLKPVYPDFAEGSEERNISTENKRFFNSAELEDHHALIPLAALPGNTSEEEKNVYLLVAERFFTALKLPYIYNAVKITVDIEKHLFAGNGVEALQAGWKRNKKDDEENEDAQSLEGLEENGRYPVLSVKREEKFTEPKKHYTYATLLQLMENPRNSEGKKLAGLGTPATRGSILKNITDRQYIEFQGKSILITGKGRTLIETVRQSDSIRDFISIAETTRWEEKMREDPASFVEGVRAFVGDAIKNTKIDITPGAWDGIGKCPLCGKPVKEGNKNYYCTGYKEGCAFVIWKTVAGAAVSKSEAAALMEGKTTKLKKCKGKEGKEFGARFKLEGGKIIFEFEKRPAPSR
jgi:DNA topoisomerase-3